MALAMKLDHATTDGFLSVARFATVLGVTEPTVHRWVRNGVLPCVRLGRTVLIPADALKRMLEKQEAAHAP